MLELPAVDAYVTLLSMYVYITMLVGDSANIILHVINA